MFLVHTAWRNFGSFCSLASFSTKKLLVLGFLAHLSLSLVWWFHETAKLQGQIFTILFLHSSSCDSNGCCKRYHYCQPVSWRCFLSQESVSFNTEHRLREECALSLAFVSEHLYAFFVSKITSSSWLMLSKLNPLTGTTSMCRPVLVFLKVLCQAQKCYTFFCFVCDHACFVERVRLLDATWSFTD